MVCMFSLTLLSMYKIGQLHMFATKSVGSCVCVSPLGYVFCEAEKFEEDGIVLLHEEKDQDNGENLCTGRHLNDGQLRELQNLLNQYSDVMQTKPGRTHLAEHNIETGAARPVKQPPYRLPHAYQDEVLKELAEMEKEGVIESSMSEWASPMVLVKKKDGSLRMCVDYRRLNSVSQADAYPMPHIDELIDQMGKAQYISTMDLSCGYWQVPVEAASRDKTAFVTPQGLSSDSMVHQQLFSS